MRAASREPAPAECAVCGADIPPHARACPACGADERTGWRESSIYDGLDLPDEDDETAPKRPRHGGLPWYWWLVGVLVLVALGLTVLGLR
jgi:predicted nucleic acid-binding Zn ribbon protein